MDAAVVVGVGNIYASESLFLAGIRPTRAVGRLRRHTGSAFVRRYNTYYKLPLTTTAQLCQIM